VMRELTKVLNWMAVQYAALVIALGLLLLGSQLAPVNLTPPPATSVEMPAPAPVTDEYAALLACMDQIQTSTAADC